MKKRDIFYKWQIVNESSKQNGCEFFTPNNARKSYGVNFIDLEFTKDYETTLSATIDKEGASPSLDIRFTDKGIKKLLKSNRQMREEVENEYEGLKKEFPDEYNQALFSVLRGEK